MFKTLSLAGLKNSKSFGYAADVPFFQGRKKLDFKPGLNILFGPNGCGKSTVLQILGRTMCAVQGGVSTVTQSAVDDNVDMMTGLGRAGARMRSNIGLKVSHDGQPVVFCDPRARIGLYGVGSAFDDDFFAAGMDEVANNSRRSHGEACLSRASVALAILEGKAAFPKEVVRRLTKKSVNSTWGEALDVLEADMQASIPLGQGSVLLDEPEANFSLLWQARLWKRLADEDVAHQYQVIVATHSPFALGIPHAHYIDFAPEFRQEAERMLRERFATA